MMGHSQHTFFLTMMKHDLFMVQMEGTYGKGDCVAVENGDHGKV